MHSVVIANWEPCPNIAMMSIEADQKLSSGGEGRLTSANGEFFSKIAMHDYKSPILHIASMMTHNAPYCPKKEQYYRHTTCHNNHLHPSRWLLSTVNQAEIAVWSPRSVCT